MNLRTANTRHKRRLAKRVWIATFIREAARQFAQAIRERPA